MSAPARLVRTRGIEAPYNKDQVAAFVLHPIISVVRVGVGSNRPTVAVLECNTFQTYSTIFEVFFSVYWICTRYSCPICDLLQSLFD